MAALNNSDKDKGVREVAEYANLDARRNMSLFGLAGQILAAALYVSLKGDDDDDDELLSDKEGASKLRKKIAMGFPVFYATYAYANATEDNKTMATIAALGAPVFSRHPTVLTYGKADSKKVVEWFSDIYSINAYEALKSWYNAFVSEDKELKKRTNQQICKRWYSIQG